ncbi:hypothetical protein FACS1894155_02420 [Bacteroidia bacterium]|nr:hypothetical protein FACS1894155_02420 [Bacteroidia bacterium]
MFVIVISFSSCNKEKEVKRIHYNGSYNRDFNDLNDLHLMAAKKIGIKPPSTRDEIEKIKKELREIKSSKTYEVEELKHSIPYLVPKAANLLEMIGKNFRDSLEHLNVPNYKLIVTSLTRTDEDVTKLRRGNLNSSSNSAHTYATTFDISWVRYTKNDKTKTEITSDQLKMVLASVLRDLKKEGKCYVKHERKQGCFHITVK